MGNVTKRNSFGSPYDEKYPQLIKEGENIPWLNKIENKTIFLTYVGKNVYVHEDVIFGPQVSLIGNTTIHKKCQIGINQCGVSIQTEIGFGKTIFAYCIIRGNAKYPNVLPAHTLVENGEVYYQAPRSSIVIHTMPTVSE